MVCALCVVQVLAIEPVHVNFAMLRERVKWFTNRYRAYHNITGKPMLRISVVHGGLGAKAGTSGYASFLDHMRVRNIGGSSGIQTGTSPEYLVAQNTTERTSFKVFTVDELLQSRKQRLALAHWDLEGGEVSLLEGARRTIERDRPLFTLEAFPTTNPAAYKELRAKVYGLGYRMLEIPESCGNPPDCRNFVCAHVDVWHQLRRLHGCQGTEARAHTR